MKESELFVITKAKDLCNYVFTVTDKSPKKFRFSFVSRMQNLSLNIMEYLFRANDIYIGIDSGASNKQVRIEWQQKAITDLRLLNYFSLIAMEQQCILPKQYEQIAKMSEETLFLAIRWKNSVK